ncbi:MAG: hypothetical protein KF752_05275 [Pirellulaceae bacterium]|nr:hypothetical protein [Pirellulaceae bacterium]
MTAIDDCSDIADGEGSVVTGRFITRQANDLARVTVARLPPTVQEIISRNALASGSPDVLADLEQLARLGLVDLETLEGTERHPVWSEDQQDWMPLGQLQPGQTLRAADGPAVVLSVTIHNHIVPVYNIEIHGQHVYQVGELGLLVHNACPVDAAKALAKKLRLNYDSPTTKTILENIDSPVSSFESSFRQGKILQKLPGEVLNMPLHEALKHSTMVRKLLTDLRFVK